MKEDELQSILNYLLTMHEVHACIRLDIYWRGRETKKMGHVHYNLWAGVMVHLNVRV